MDLFDFFFPEESQATSLRRIADKFTLPQKSDDGSAQIKSLRGDVNFLTLVLTSILKRLDETQILSLGDVQDILGDADTMDGVADNGLDPRLLRGLLGALDPEVANNLPDDRDEFKIVTTPRYRR